jgi:DNA polymerase III delta prime subunit
MLPINKQSLSKINAFIENPSHAAALIGPMGSGTFLLALYIRDKLFENNEIDARHYDAYSKVLDRGETKSIGIADILELEKFLYLKVPIRKNINRIVIIKDAHLLTIEAQNALLKTLEEPPQGTVLILASESQKTLLSTVRSRLQTIFIEHPDISILREYFTKQGHTESEIHNALKISGGLPELADSILNEKNHPLIPATEIVREMLLKSVFERLCMVDSLSKDRELCLHVMTIFHQMARVSLMSGKTKHAAWIKILDESNKARDALELNAQPKIVLSNFLLRI